VQACGYAGRLEHRQASIQADTLAGNHGNQQQDTQADTARQAGWQAGRPPERHSGRKAKSVMPPVVFMHMFILQCCSFFFLLFSNFGFCGKHTNGCRRMLCRVVFTHRVQRLRTKCSEHVKMTLNR